MEYNVQSNFQTTIPPQKKSTRSKNAKDKQWYKDNIDAYEALALEYESELHRKMGVWEDLDNGIIDEKEMERVFNPMELQNANFPAATKNFPIIVPKLDLLQGEEINRTFEYYVKGVNDDTDSNEEQDLFEMFMDMLIKEIQLKGYDEEKLKSRIQKFSKYAKYTYKTAYELAATRILEYLWTEQELKSKFNEGFRDVLKLGREIYRIDDEGNEPVVVKTNVRNVFPINMGNSKKIEDAEAIIEIEYMPVSKVIDAFYDYLKPEEIDMLEQSIEAPQGGSVLGYKNEKPVIYSNLDFGEGPGFVDISEFGDEAGEQMLAFDGNGNVRVVRSRWTSRKKVGTLTFIDENTGEQDTRLVSEYYKPIEELGETVKWFWVNEAMEATKIANNIYVKMEPRKIQRRHFDNKSKSFLGYVGYDYGPSLTARLEPYQYQYNVYMRKLELLMSKYKGPIYELDLAKIPDDWEIDKWMYYAEYLGWAALDNFNESKKGISTGKLAGAFNTTGKVMDSNAGNMIQQTVMFLQFIENQMAEISGISKQRQGEISNRETAQGVERSVTQSSHTTEKWFFPHDDVKKRVLMALLDTAKHMWKDSNSKKLSFVLDDLSRVFIEFSPAEIASTEYDVFVTNSSKDTKTMQLISNLVQPAIQNGASLKLAIDVSRADSISQAANLIEQAEEEAARRQDETEKRRDEALKYQADKEEQSKQADRDMKKYEIDKDYEIKLIEIEAKLGEQDVEPEDTSTDEAKLTLDKEKVDETKRHNMATEEIDRSKVEVSKKAKTNTK